MAQGAAGGGRTAIRVVPAALAALADGVSADAAAQLAMGRLGERDLAAGLLAERIRAADAFAATYGVPWWPAYLAIDRAIRDDGVRTAIDYRIDRSAGRRRARSWPSPCDLGTSMAYVG